jgi:hypothetical protein
VRCCCCGEEEEEEEEERKERDDGEVLGRVRGGECGSEFVVSLLVVVVVVWCVCVCFFLFWEFGGHNLTRSISFLAGTGF